MVAEKKVTVAQGEEAKLHPIKLVEKQRPNELAPYFVEELRRYLERKYGTSAVHEGGLKVYSTLNVEMQKAANTAIRTGLRVDDKRHGWRGAERKLVNEGVTDLPSVELPDWKPPMRTNDIVPGVVIEVTRNGGTLKLGNSPLVSTAQAASWSGRKDV